MNYSFKRGWSRPTNCKRPDTVYSESIFSSRALSLFYQRWTIINIDESSFNRSLKRNYSWLPKCKSSPLINEDFTGRASLIFGLFSTGDWIGWIVDSTVNSKLFSKFIIILNKYIEHWTQIKKDKTVVFLDNAAVHTSKLSFWTANQNGLKYCFLPQYSPHLAPVEVIFGITKKKMSSTPHASKINFSKNTGKDAIWNALESISKTLVQKLWMKFVREAKAAVVNAQKAADDIAKQAGIDYIPRERSNEKDNGFDRSDSIYDGDNCGEEEMGESI